jgi:hypothetical protein
MNAPSANTNTRDSVSADHESTRSDGERARELVERLSAGGGRSTAEILSELRQAFPHSPLSVRIATLAALSAHYSR